MREEQPLEWDREWCRRWRNTRAQRSYVVFRALTSFPWPAPSVFCANARRGWGPDPLLASHWAVGTFVAVSLGTWSVVLSFIPSSDRLSWCNAGPILKRSSLYTGRYVNGISWRNEGGCRLSSNNFLQECSRSRRTPRHHRDDCHTTRRYIRYTKEKKIRIHVSISATITCFILKRYLPIARRVSLVWKRSRRYHNVIIK